MSPGPDLHSAIAWLRDFAARFPEARESDRASMELKLNHSLRVMQEAERIASSLDATDRALRLSLLAALLHDVGRFPQYSRYRTFKDQISVNHALLGFRTLRQEVVLNDLPAVDRKLVLQCVLLHNKPRLPPSLPPDLDFALRVVRDADKLDIVSVVLPYLEDPDLSGSEAVTLGLADHPGRYSGSVLRRLRTGQPVSYADMTYRNDFRLLLAGWVFDLNYAKTRRLFLHRDHLRSIMAALPQTREVRELARALHSFLCRDPAD
jgi:putative nucleotidyltransferase with HDIG domain